VWELQFARTMSESKDQGQGYDGSELGDIAKRCQWSLKKLARRIGKRAAEGPRVAGADQHNPSADRSDEKQSLWDPTASNPEQADGRQRGGADYWGSLRHHDPAAGKPGRA
jgi:hypothetical protein